MHASLPMHGPALAGGAAAAARGGRPHVGSRHAAAPPGPRLQALWRRQEARRACLPRAAPSEEAPGGGEGGPSVVTEEDRAYIRRALALAARAAGATHPNPAVGCVLVQGGVVVGEGYHPRAGLPHAEVYALRGAGRAAAGATAYVTLEPCNHYGRTPPCSRALVAAGVARVVVGTVDPNPLVGGAGIRTLLAAGVPVAVGCEEAACQELNSEFMARMAAQAAAAAAAAA